MSDGVPDGSLGRTRQLPVFHCPYCGDEELTPHGDGDGANERPEEWHCAACLRTFAVRLTGTGVTTA